MRLYLYEAYPPVEARRIAQRLEFHNTPKHGSWLNMTEIEFSILKRQCLDRRIADQDTLRQEIKAWENSRNAKGCTINWRFTTEDARRNSCVSTHQFRLDSVLVALRQISSPF